MLDQNELHTGLYNWLNEVSNGQFQSIIAEQNGTQPLGDYVTYKINSYNPNGMAFVDYDQYSQNYSMEVTLNAYGKDAIVILHRCVISLEKPTVREILCAADMIYNYQITPIIDISETVQKSYQHRATCDLMFTTTVYDSDNVGLIETVEINEV